MRIDAVTLLLGLAALGNLPTSSARVLYGYASPGIAVVGHDLNNTNIEQRAVVLVEPVPKPIPKPVPHEGPEAPIVPGDRTPNVPGDKTPGSEPAPLVPGDKTPNAPDDRNPGSEPIRLVPEEPVAPKDPATPAPDKDPKSPATDKDPATPATDKDTGPVPKDQADDDLWCASPGGVSKRGVESRTPGSCSSRAGDRQGDELRQYYNSRADKAERYISHRPEQNNYSGRIKDNYDMVADIPDAYLDEYIKYMGYDDGGFTAPNYVKEETGTWSTFVTESKGNGNSPVSRISYGRSNDGKDIAIIAHERYRNRDSNMYQLDGSGNARIDEHGDYVMADGWEEKSVAVSDLVSAGARSGGYNNGHPRSYFLMSQGIQGVESRRIIDDAFEGMVQQGVVQQRTIKLEGETKQDLQYMVLRKGAAGFEGEAYKLVTSIDNNYSYTNTMTRNRDYDDFIPYNVEVYRKVDHKGGYFEYATSYNWQREKPVATG